MATKKQKEDEKITNEQPVSLNPLSFEDALRGLLATPPQNVKAKKKKVNPNTKDEKA